LVQGEALAAAHCLDLPGGKSGLEALAPDPSLGQRHRPVLQGRSEPAGAAPAQLRH